MTTDNDKAKGLTFVFIFVALEAAAATVAEKASSLLSGKKD